MNGRTAIVIVCVAALGIFGVAASAHAQAVRVQPGLIERAMPDFSLAGLDGRTVTLSQFKGRTVILVFPPNTVEWTITAGDPVRVGARVGEWRQN